MKLRLKTKDDTELLDYSDLLPGHIYEVVSDDPEDDGDIVIKLDQWASETLVTIAGRDAGASWNEYMQGVRFKELSDGSVFILE